MTFPARFPGQQRGVSDGVSDVTTPSATAVSPQIAGLRAVIPGTSIRRLSCASSAMTDLVAPWKDERLLGEGTV
jgi:hypothetical protein